MDHALCFSQDTFTHICWVQNHMIFKELVSYNTKTVSKLPLNSNVPTFPFCTGGSGLREHLPFSRFLLKSPVLRWSWLECQVFMNFSTWSRFSQTRLRILATSSKIRCEFCSWPPSSSWVVDPCQQNTYCFSTSERSVRNKFKNQYSL